jgi:hypothetical protein
MLEMKLRLSLRPVHSLITIPTKLFLLLTLPSINLKSQTRKVGNFNRTKLPLLYWRYSSVWILVPSLVLPISSRRFVTFIFFRRGVVSSTPNPQSGGPATILLLVRTLLTCLTWVALPGTYAPVSIVLRVIGARKPSLHDKAQLLVNLYN